VLVTVQETERGDRAAVVVTSTEVIRLQVFNRTSSKVSGFIITYRLYIRIKIREVAVYSVGVVIYTGC